ncbi:hypothetical protein [Methylomonas koyamae]|uniref:hypothetical protein n=1 Tax=Methylomonas koyamae TaxID=702114 RepID=UPI0006D0366A|nr:hypothetical protein [Methylomonas koyamae]BBL56537.1 hypothetical protein MKFW12EY_01500 [Methylomonas koyamae]
MGQIKGYVEIDLTKTSGEIESIRVDGSEFGLESGGDWARDRDDLELCAGFLFIAFCEGFDLLLSVSIHGNSNTDYNLRVRENDLEEFEIQKVVITEDELDISNLFPNDDVDVD